MKKLPALLIFGALFIVHPLFSQAPSVMWERCLGGNNGDYAWSIEPTMDGGFIVGGYTEGLSNGDVVGYHGNVSVGDIWITKTDNNGHIQWQKCLGGTFFETGAVIHQTADGGYIVAGTAASRDCSITGNHGGSDYWVVKLNVSGDIMWQKLYGGSKNEYAYSLSLTPDGGYIVAGETESSDGDITLNHGQRDYWVIKIDGAGNLLWQKSLGGSGMDESYGSQATADGGCIVAGYTQSNDGDVTGYHGNNDYWVVKLDNGGNIQWQRALGGSDPDVALSVQLTQDGGYIVAGSAGSNNGDVSGNHHGLPGGPDLDFWVVKLNSAGVLQWQKCYGGNLNEIAYYVQPTRDGGYLVCGSSESSDGDLTCNASLTDMWVIKIDGNGNLLWQKELGGNFYDEAHCVKELSDGTSIVAGSTCSTNIQGFHVSSGAGSCADFWIIKLSTPLATPPNPVISIDPSSVSVCSGLPATLTATALYAGLNPTYQWTKNGVAVGGNSPSYTASGLAAGDNITCKVSSGGTPCEAPPIQATATASISINGNVINPVVTIVADNTVVCGCTTVTFKASVANTGSIPVFQWKVNGVSTGIVTNYFISNLLNPGDNVTCTYSDNGSCVTGGSVVSNAIQMKGGTAASPSVNIAVSQDTICSGASVSFTASPVNAGANPSYQWKLNGVDTGMNNPVFTSTTLADGDQVSCQVTPDPAFSCSTGGLAVSNIVVMHVVNKGNPVVTISTATDSICTGYPASFTAGTQYAGANPSYQWFVNGVAAGAGGPTFTSSTLANGDLVSCNIIVDPLFTCSTSNSANSNSLRMIVKSQPAPTVSIADSANDVCAGTPVNFTADVQDAGNNPSYQWKQNNANIGGNTNVLTGKTFFNGDAVYCVLTPGAGACSNAPVSSNTIVVIIEDTPGVSISPGDTIITVGQQMQLRGTVTGTIGSFQWSPAGSLQDPLDLSPYTIHLTNDTYFTLTVKSDKGCLASAVAFVKVGRPIHMPNAFTPNGDGLNDLFRIPPGTSLQLQEFSIFDRWGNKIFSTQNISKGWDGTFNGTPSDAGTYVYMIRGTDEKGNVFVKGTVVLVR